MPIKVTMIPTSLLPLFYDARTEAMNILITDILQLLAYKGEWPSTTDGWLDLLKLYRRRKLPYRILYQPKPDGPIMMDVGTPLVRFLSISTLVRKAGKWIVGFNTLRRYPDQ